MLADGLLAAAGAALGGCAGGRPWLPGGPAAYRLDEPKFMWAYLAHFGVKMWESRSHYTDLKLDDSMWQALTERLAEKKFTAIVIDLGEGMVYPSHPELAVKGSWAPERMKEEIARLGKMGLLAIPKLNFSASHDQWLGKWRPYLSTPEYFQVCSDVIRDVAEVFDASPLFHIGYDEETYFIQDHNKFPYVRLRRGDLWWRDFLWFVDEVGKHGMRPWIWSDYCWTHRDEFLARMPKTVLQSNWYYEKDFAADKLTDHTRPMVEAYDVLEKARYDQIPCGSTYSCDENFGLTVSRCRSLVRPDRLKGFLMAPWYYRTQEDLREKILKSVDVAGREIEKWSSS